MGGEPTDERESSAQPSDRRSRTEDFLPPATIEESGWDILLALRSDPACELSLAKLAALVSVTPSALQQWLAKLESQRFITAMKHGITGELRAVLTMPARHLLEAYLAASNDLCFGTRH